MAVGALGFVSTGCFLRRWTDVLHASHLIEGLHTGCLLLQAIDERAGIERQVERLVVGSMLGVESGRKVLVQVAVAVCARHRLTSVFLTPAGSLIIGRLAGLTYFAVMRLADETGGEGELMAVTCQGIAESFYTFR